MTLAGRSRLPVRRAKYGPFLGRRKFLPGCAARAGTFGVNNAGALTGGHGYR
jgi:hypothetical protein